VLLYLLIPIGVMILYSFNQSHSALPQVTFKWQGFTTQWYKEWNQVPELTPAFFLSLKLGVLASSLATQVAAEMTAKLGRALEPGRWLAVGDSGNDAALFAQFPVSAAVGNVRAHLSRLPVPPAFIADEERGHGFAAIAGAVLRGRG